MSLTWGPDWEPPPSRMSSRNREGHGHTYRPTEAVVSHALSIQLSSHLPEERKRDDWFIEPPCCHEINPVGVGSIVPPGSLGRRDEGWEWAGVTQKVTQNPQLWNSQPWTLQGPVRTEVIPREARLLAFCSSYGKKNLLDLIISDGENRRRSG